MSHAPYYVFSFVSMADSFPYQLWTGFITTKIVRRELSEQQKADVMAMEA